MSVNIAVFRTELGWMAIRRCQHRVSRLVFGFATKGQACQAIDARDFAENRYESDDLVERIVAFAAGEFQDFLDVQLDLPPMTSFQRRVVQACRRIPFGQTASYAELATRAGSPRAARAVGNVMATNRVPLIVPCHRVVGSNQRLGGFSAPTGLDMKRRLLKLEQVALLPL